MITATRGAVEGFERISTRGPWLAAAVLSVLRSALGRLAVLTLMVLCPAPAQTVTISTQSVTAGGPSFTLTFNGSGLTTAMTASWTSLGTNVTTSLTTRFVDSTTITAIVPAGLIAQADYVNVHLSAPGFGFSAGLVVIPPPAVITSITPTSAAPVPGGLCDHPGITITVNGSGFVPNQTIDVYHFGSYVEFAGLIVNPGTTFVSPNQLTAVIPACDLNLGNPGPAPILVQVFENGGGTISNSLPFNIVPVINTPYAPLTHTNYIVAGGSPFQLVVLGAGFFSNSIIQWNGVALLTQFVSVEELHATVPSNLFTIPGSANVTVATLGVSSSPSIFTILPPPTITFISPASAVAGTTGLQISVSGSNLNGGTVQWNGIPLSTTAIGSGLLTATVPANLLSSPGIASINVVLFGVVSNTINYNVAPGLVIDSLNPNAATAGGTAFILTVNGTGFASDAAVQWDGQGLPTTFVSATQLTASVSASLISVARTATISVLSGGATSNALGLTIASGPAISSL